MTKLLFYCRDREILTPQRRSCDQINTLKIARNKAHKSFDPLWRERAYRTGESIILCRSLAYKWLSEEMNIKEKYCHMRYLTKKDCKKVLKICLIASNSLKFSHQEDDDWIRDNAGFLYLGK